jgi:hypothetical protein
LSSHGDISFFHFLRTTIIRMRYHFLLGALALVVAPVSAFPAAMLEHMSRQNDAKGLEEIEAAILKLKRGEPFVKRAPGFNAQQQYVSNQGANAFVPPNFSKGDQRGPCPGLNAMANHGYLPHNGYATIDQYITGTNKGNSKFRPNVLLDYVKILYH